MPAGHRLRSPFLHIHFTKNDGNDGNDGEYCINNIRKEVSTLGVSLFSIASAMQFICSRFKEQSLASRKSQ